MQNTTHRTRRTILDDRLYAVVYCPPTDEEANTAVDTLPFTKKYAQQAAEIHIEGQPRTFLTRLGPEVLACLYEAMAESPLVIGKVIVDGDRVAVIAIASQDTNRMFSDIKWHHWHRLAWPMIKQFLRSPSILIDIWQNIRYPVKLGAPDNEAEILFLGMRREYMRHGIAPRLGIEILNEWHERGGCLTASAVIDKRNRAMRWTVATIPGARLENEVTINGRTMAVYRADLPLELPVEKTDTRKEVFG